MILPAFGASSTSEELQELRQLIGQHALQCGLDLNEKSAVRQFLDSDYLLDSALSPDSITAHELRAMLILLFRLESCSSEDLGFEGLCRLWLEHSEILVRHRPHETSQRNESRLSR